MKPTMNTFSALLATGFCIYLTAQVGESQHVPARCRCPTSRLRTQGPFSDFSVTLRGSGCGQDEIIVILKKNNQPVCLNPQGHQGSRLLKCWHRKMEEGGDKKTCVRRLRKWARKGRKMQRGKPKKARSSQP